ncbi:MAG: Asp-tRNA(Asn)/Glu-tRNA(Gln) amidotransferase subunit GatA [Bacillota bacterium]
MKLNDKTVYELHQLLAKREVSVAEIVTAYRRQTEALEPEINAFIHFDGENVLRKAKELDDELAGGKELTPLTGIPIGLKDNIATKGIATTNASKMLKDYFPPFNAAVVDKLVSLDGIMFGKLNMDELAMGTSGENSAFGPTKNPWDFDKVPGGSSSGSAASVASGSVPLSLGTDAGGSIRQPAALCGVVGLKPTYGLVSRYGVTPMAASMDCVGPLARNVRDCAILLGALAGQDGKDATTLAAPKVDYLKALEGEVKGLRVGVPEEYFGDNVDAEIKSLIFKALRQLESMGALIEEFSLPYSPLALTAYHLIAPTEISSNLARLDGVRYGFRDQQAEDVEAMFLGSRSKGLGREAKFRTILGHFASGPGHFQDYYVKGLKMRTLVQEDFERAFDRYDILVTPTSGRVAWSLNNEDKKTAGIYTRDICTIPVNLAGLPALSLPCGLSDGLPVGLQLIGNKLSEALLLKTAYNLEQAIDFPKELKGGRNND